MLFRALVFGSLLAAPLYAQVGCAPESGVQFQEALKVLSDREEFMVSGAAVGFAAQPGEWYQQACLIRNNGTKEQLLGLLDHERVHVRAAGMYALARTLPEVALPAIRARLESEVELDLLAGGCCVERVTEGELARRFLHDRYVLDLGQEPAPLLPAGEVGDGAQAAPAPETERFRAAKAKLLEAPEDLCVSGSAVGRGAQPGRFYLLAKELAAEATEAQLRALLSHERVLVRAAGIYGLAQRFPEVARAACAPLRESEAQLDFQPGGCSVRTITEGQLVEAFSQNRHVLELMAPVEPLPEAR